MPLAGGMNLGASVPVSIAGPGTSTSAGAIESLGGANTIAGPVTLTGATQLQSDAGTLTVSGNIDITAGVITYAGAGNINVTGAMTSTAVAGMIKSGAGTLTLAPVNTFRGPITLNAGSPRSWTTVPWAAAVSLPRTTTCRLPCSPSGPPR